MLWWGCQLISDAFGLPGSPVGWTNISYPFNLRMCGCDAPKSRNLKPFYKSIRIQLCRPLVQKSEPTAIRMRIALNWPQEIHWTCLKRTPQVIRFMMSPFIWAITMKSRSSNPPGRPNCRWCSKARPVAARPVLYNIWLGEWKGLWSQWPAMKICLPQTFWAGTCLKTKRPYGWMAP